MTEQLHSPSWGKGGNGTEPPTVNEHLYKVLIVGDFGVGKTSIIRRYTEGVFSSHYKLTIGVDFALKAISWDEHTKINLQLWDIAGHERFGHMTRVYYKYAIAAIIVFDLTRAVTFDSVNKWLKDVNQKVVLDNEESVPVMLLANKCDLSENCQVEDSVLDEFCTEHNIIGWFPTSAKTNTNIEEAMSYLIEKILEVSGRQRHSPSPMSEHLDGIDVIDGATLMDDTRPNGHATHHGQKQSPEKRDCCPV